MSNGIILIKKVIWLLVGIKLMDIGIISKLMVVSLEKAGIG